MRNKKGLSLVEVLLMIVLIGLLGVAALTLYFNSSETFQFLSEYKNVVSIFREVRANAISNKNSENVERYGIKIESNKITMFADAVPPFSYNAESDELLKEVSINSPYEIGFLTGDTVMPVYLYYDIGTGNLTSYHGNDVLLSKDDTKRLDFKFSDGANLEKFISVFQVTGITEEFKTQPQ